MFFGVLQLIALSKACAQNLSDVGTMGTALTPEVDGTTFRCHYYDVAGRDFDFTIHGMGTVIAIVISAAIAALALLRIVSLARGNKG